MNTHIIRQQAIKSLNPNVISLSMNLDTEEVIDALDAQGVTTPIVSTDAEITAEVTRLQAEYDSNQYQRDRVVAYPSIGDQADMAYWDRQNGTTTLDDAITAVKEAHPKPA
jgi:hypothetical protein